MRRASSKRWAPEVLKTDVRANQNDAGLRPAGPCAAAVRDLPPSLPRMRAAYWLSGQAVADSKIANRSRGAQDGRETGPFQLSKAGTDATIQAMSEEIVQTKGRRPNEHDDGGIVVRSCFPGYNSRS
jgi:hypothetical protein